jgi:hypothetical protein
VLGASCDGLFEDAEDKRLREGPSGKSAPSRFDSNAQRGRRAATNSASEANMANARLGWIRPAFRRSAGGLGAWDRVIGLRAGKVFKEVKPAAAGARLAPVATKEVDYR